MSLTTEQCDLIQTSWNMVTSQNMCGWNFTETFYNIVFDISPDCKVLFKNDMVLQGDALVGMLATVVKNIKHLSTIKQAVIDLGIRHKTYGVRKNMYLVVGRALVQTLGDLLGEVVTVDIKNAWMDAYSVLASIMIKASGNNLKASLIRCIIDPDYLSVEAFQFIVSNKNTLKAFENKKGTALKVKDDDKKKDDKKKGKKSSLFNLRNKVQPDDEPYNPIDNSEEARISDDPNRQNEAENPSNTTNSNVYKSQSVTIITGTHLCAPSGPTGNGGSRDSFGSVRSDDFRSTKKKKRKNSALSLSNNTSRDSFGRQNSRQDSDVSTKRKESVTSTSSFTSKSDTESNTTSSSSSALKKMFNLKTYHKSSSTPADTSPNEYSSSEILSAAVPSAVEPSITKKKKIGTGDDLRHSRGGLPQGNLIDVS